MTQNSTIAVRGDPNSRGNSAPALSSVAAGRGARDRFPIAGPAVSKHRRLLTQAGCYGVQARTPQDSRACSVEGKRMWAIIQEVQELEHSSKSLDVFKGHREKELATIRKCQASKFW